MKKIILAFQIQLTEYRQLVKEYENKGIENLDLEDTETYGVFTGKVEMLEMLIPKLEAMDFDITELWETNGETSHDCIKVADIVKIFS